MSGLDTDINHICFSYTDTYKTWHHLNAKDNDKLVPKRSTLHNVNSLHWDRGPDIFTCYITSCKYVVTHTVSICWQPLDKADPEKLATRAELSLRI